MNHYNVHWKLGEKQGKCCIPAISKADVTIGFNQYAHMDMGNPYNIPFEAEITKIVQVGRIATPKQKLAQRYGFIMGSIKGAQQQFRSLRDTSVFFSVKPATSQIGRAVALADSQFSKLQRDISDVFKLAGLKIK